MGGVDLSDFHDVRKVSAMEDLTTIGQIVADLTFTGFLVYVWYSERDERRKAQKEHNEDLREMAGAKPSLSNS